MIDSCPFCSIILERWIESTRIVYICTNEECEFHEQTRYIYTMDPTDTFQLTEEYMFDNIYVKVDVQSDSSVLYKLDVCALVDPVPIPRALCLNVKNYLETLDRVKLLLTLS